jgi:hypothetical protein
LSIIEKRLYTFFIAVIRGITKMVFANTQLLDTGKAEN